MICALVQCRIHTHIALITYTFLNELGSALWTYELQNKELIACHLSFVAMNMPFYFFKSLSVLKISLILAHSWIYCVFCPFRCSLYTLGFEIRILKGNTWTEICNALSHREMKVQEMFINRDRNQMQLKGEARITGQLFLHYHFSAICSIFIRVT